MICKSISHTEKINYKIFIEYVLNKEKKHSKEDRWAIVQNIDCTSSNVQGLVSAFQKYERLKPKRKTPTTRIFHEIISASPNAPVDADIMFDLANKYLELRNKNNGIALASYHTDKEHKHVHIMLSGGNDTGKSTRISKKEFFKIREEFERYQLEKYPNIKDIVYLPEYKKEKNKESSKDKQSSKFKSDAEFNLEKRLEKRGHNTDKNKLKDLLHDSFEKAENKTHLFSLLQSKEGIEVYNYRGKPTGLMYNERKYRFKKLIDTPELQNKFMILERLEELSKFHKSHEREDLER